VATEKRKSLKPSESGSNRSKRSSGAPDLPGIFIDRSLGKDIARLLRAAGFPEVVHLSDVFPDDGQQTPDPEWIAYAATHGLVAFSKDAALKRDHSHAVRVHEAVVFLLPDQSMSGTAQATRYLENKFRIAMKASKGGPAIYMVRPRSVERVGP
jgi:predicted nuclease of predicted toxin-antitoxin system